MADEDNGEVSPNRLEKMQERMAAAKAERGPVDDDDTNEVVVQEKPEPDDDDELEPEIPKTRDEKRAARRRQSLREQTAAAEAKAEVYRQELESLRTRGGATQPAPQGNANAHLDRQYLEVEKEQESLIAEYRRLERDGKLTDAIDNEMRGKARVLEIRRTALVVDMKSAYDAPRRAQEAQISELQRRHPEVWANQAALRYAEGEFNKRIARGEPDTMETHDAAAEEAKQVILGKRPKPDGAARARATGMSGGSRGAPARDAPVSLSMPVGSRMYQLACARYPNLEPKQACQKWANSNGKAFLEASSKRDR